MVFFAREMRWPIVGSGCRKARAISAVVRPPTRRSVSATRDWTLSTGWQATNISRSRSSAIASSSRQLVERHVVRADLRRTSPPACGHGGTGRSPVAWRRPSTMRRGCAACRRAATAAGPRPAPPGRTPRPGRGRRPSAPVPRRAGGTRCGRPPRPRRRRSGSTRPWNTGRTRTSPSPTTPMNRFDHSIASARSRHSMHRPAADELLGLGERAVGDGVLAVLQADLGAHRRRGDAARGQDDAGGNGLGDEGIHLLEQLGTRRRGGRRLVRQGVTEEPHLISPSLCVRLRVATSNHCVERSPLASTWSEESQSSLRAEMKTSPGTSTRPIDFIFFLPSFCFSSSLRLRVMSPP